MTSPFDWLEDRLTRWEPKRRRRFALHLVVWTVLVGHVNMALYLAGIIGERELIAVTLYLSWLALSFAAAEIVVSTDVRAEA